MKNLFISLNPDPPTGFEYKTPDKKELRNSNVAVLADSSDVFFLYPKIFQKMLPD